MTDDFIIPSQERTTGSILLLIDQIDEAIMFYRILSCLIQLLIPNHCLHLPLRQTAVLN